jgi:hypothetical protein
LAQPLSLETPTSLLNQNVVTNQPTQMQANTNIQSIPNVQDSIFGVNDKGKGKKKSTAKVQIVNKPWDPNQELIDNANKPMYYDDKTPTQLVKNASAKVGISPKLLYSSAWIEGMNKASIRPDLGSEAYKAAAESGKFNENDFPVDGFYNYGIDTFGENYNRLEKYLPKDFKNKFKLFLGEQELTKAEKKAGKKHGKIVNTAAFSSNEDALVAKAAFLKAEQDNVNSYAKEKGIDLDEDAKDYFTMAAYNTGFGNAKKMLEEYFKSKDKKSFIEKGETSFKGVHRNISKRRNIMGTATKLLGS